MNKKLKVRNVLEAIPFFFLLAIAIYNRPLSLKKEQKNKKANMENSRKETVLLFPMKGKICSDRITSLKI